MKKNTEKLVKLLIYFDRYPDRRKWTIKEMIEYYQVNMHSGREELYDGALRFLHLVKDDVAYAIINLPQSEINVWIDEEIKWINRQIKESNNPVTKIKFHFRRKWLC